MKPGVYEGMPWDDYDAIDAMSNSRLSWLIEESPAYYRYRMSLPPEPEKPALRFGKATHCAVLEAERFAAEYVPEPETASLVNSKTGEPFKSPRASKPYKEAVARLEAEGKIVILQDEYYLAVLVAAHFRTHPRVGALLDTAEGTEITLVWERDGLLCKARLDVRGPGWFMDIKTTRNFGGFSPWEVTRWSLHRQLAFYHSGTLACGLDCEIPYFAVAANDSPDVACFQLELGSLQAGKAENDRGWDTYLACRKSGKWPGRYDPQLVHSASISDQYFDRLMEAGLL